jgi:hypothetical protein|nr:(2Fe-2S) ferredoxin domain-containing protein [Turicibacter sanguinis]
MKESLGIKLNRNLFWRGVLRVKTIKICVGSSCHLKGSYEVIQIFQSLIEKHQLQEVLELRAAFCLGHCTEAVSVMGPNEEVLAVSPDDAEKLFEAVIKPQLGKE